MNDKSPSPVLSEREQAILRSLIDEYIRVGAPVGSRTLSRLPGIALSAASVRNVMGDLEELGLLHAPHTSAGRVPTDGAYRLFVDSMVQYRPVADTAVDSLRQGLAAELGREQLIARASDMLSRFSQMAALVFVPAPSEETFRQIDFVPLSDRRVLMILVVNDHDVQNRVVSLDRDYSPSELAESARFLNEHFAGQALEQVRNRVRERLESLRADMADQMDHMIAVAGQVFDQADEERPSGELAMAGQTNLMALQDLSDIDRLRALFETFNSQRDMFHLLERCLHAEGVQIFIGAESGQQVLDHCSVVTAPCEREGQVLGVLGVIGPTRMAYDRVVPLVDVSAKILGAALNPSG